MANCCEDKACTLEALATRQRTTLNIVLAINAVMFVVELATGFAAHSTALMSDALDNLGDALTYGLSLYAVARGAQAKARVGVFKGILILLAGLFVAGQVVYRFFVPAAPIFEAIGIVSVLALAANATCLALLWKHRREDVNMASVWECSRNDIASNLAVFFSAVGIWLSGSRWPDLIVGAILSLLFLGSALRVLRNSHAALAAAAVHHANPVVTSNTRNS